MASRKAADAVHRDHRIELSRDHRFGLLRLALLQGLADAQHRRETGLPTPQQTCAPPAHHPRDTSGAAPNVRR